MGGWLSAVEGGCLWDRAEESSYAILSDVPSNCEMESDRKNAFK